MKKYISLITGILIFCSCGDFLKEFSQDLAYANSCADLDEILIGNGYLQQLTGFGQAQIYSDAYYPYLQVMDDDIEASIAGNGGYEVSTNTTLSYKYFYDWSDQLSINPESKEEWEDTDWRRIYAHIGYLNVIIAQVKEYTQDSIQIRKRVEGEARFLRGAYYYLLANLYANPYVKETAHQDPGIPLNLTEDIIDKYYSRNSLEECYEVIVEDLKAAAEMLKGVRQPTFYRANEAAARLLLSRVYLYMGEWQAALDECKKVAELPGIELLDLNAFKADEGERRYMLDSDNPEILFTQGTSVFNTFRYGELEWFTMITFIASDEFVALFHPSSGEKDLRLDCYLKAIGDGRYIMMKVPEYGRVYDCFVIRSAELYLNRAEAEAMLGKPEAVSTLNILRKKRFGDGKISDISHLQGEALVKFIREERRRELCFESQRWFDLRRYAVCPEYPEKKEIRHSAYKDYAYEGVYVLKPYGEDPAWVLPLPGYEIVYNQGALVDNPERTKRPLINR